MIKKDQVYVACDPRDEGRTIKVVAVYGDSRSGKVGVVTLTEDGRELRRRDMDTAVLHGSKFTRDGDVRRTGYALCED